MRACVNVPQGLAQFFIFTGPGLQWTHHTQQAHILLGTAVLQFGAFCAQRTDVFALLLSGFALLYCSVFLYCCSGHVPQSCMALASMPQVRCVKRGAEGVPAYQAYYCLAPTPTLRQLCPIKGTWEFGDSCKSLTPACLSHVRQRPLGECSHNFSILSNHMFSKPP